MDYVDESKMYDDGAESDLLGAAAFNGDQLATTFSSLPGSDFYSPPRGIVWDACREVCDGNGVVGPTTVARRLADTGRLNQMTRSIITRDMSRAVSAERAIKQASIIRDLARRRELLRAVKRAGTIVLDHPGDHTEALAAVRAQFDGIGDEDHSVGTLTWPELLDEFESAHRPGSKQVGIATPWEPLNELIGGLFPGRMYVIGGATSDGKTTAALNIALYAAGGGHKTLVFSKEMPTVDITGRLVAKGAEIDLGSINSHRLSAADRDRYRTYRQNTPNLPLRVNADPVTITGVKRISRALKHRDKLDLLIVDYLQLMTGDKAGRSAEEEIAAVSTGLKSLALELGIAVVVPAQLNRSPSARPDQRPSKSDLRGCLTGDTLITRADTGQRVPIADLVREKNVPVWTVDERLRVRRGVMSEVWSTGQQDTFRMRLSSGRDITATANHPFLTVDGWQSVGALRAGDHIATPRDIAGPSGLEWDRITAIEPTGLAETYDAHVPVTNCFIANDIVAHNSGRIEQDGDVVLLLWRRPLLDAMTQEMRPDPTRVTIIVEKNRHGPKGDVTLAWHGGFGRVG